MGFFKILIANYFKHIITSCLFHALTKRVFFRSFYVQCFILGFDLWVALHQQKRCNSPMVNYCMLKQ